jgi:hypothetical protein
MYFLLGGTMSRGPGWLERAILDLLRMNAYLSVPLLASKAYSAYAPYAPDPPPDIAIDPTRAQEVAVRRTLARLQKRGLVVKLWSVRNRPLSRKYLIACVVESVRSSYRP